MKNYCRVLMAAPKRARMEIYGDIGPAWLGMIDAKTVSDQLKLADEAEEIELRINSGGGSAWDGLAIYSQLKEHKAKVNVVVDGVAASAASVIAMAGDSVRVPANGMLMIHNPMTLAVGGEKEMQAAINSLVATKQASLAAYVAKSGKDEETIAQWMNDETWFVGQQAVDAGFADSTTPEVEVPSEVKEMAARPFSNAPSQFYQLAMRAIPKPKEEEPKKMADDLTLIAEPLKAFTAAPQLSAEDVSNAAAAAVKAERERIANITTVCNKAGKPNMAIEFIGNGASVTDVQQRMFDVLCSERVPVGEAPSQEAPTGPNAKYETEYKSNQHYASQMTMEEFVKMRRIDDGLDSLMPLKK